MRSVLSLLMLCAIAGCASVPGGATPTDASYRIVQRFTLGGAGGWDLLAADPATRRIFISRSDRVVVMDADTGKIVGEIPGTAGVHGIALAPGLMRGYTSNGRAGTVTVFDLKSLAVIGVIKVTGENPDVILYDPASMRVFAFNGHSANATVINAESLQVEATMTLPGKPELAVSDGHGRVYVNIEDHNSLAVIDPVTAKVLTNWPIPDCEEPTGLALDARHGRLFSVCDNHKMVVLDAKSGRAVAQIAIGGGPDGAAFDPATQMAFSSNGEGTLTLVHEDDPDHFRVVDHLATQKSARTLVLDLTTHRIYLPAAEFGPAPEPTAQQPHPRPSVIADTFSIIVVGQ